MWKLILAFVLFAGLALFLLSKSGAAVDMSGEKHNVEAPAATAAPATAAPATTAPAAR